jgi:hypothetical protein
MAEGIDHSTHLKSLADQQLALSQEIEKKKTLLMKVTGAIEYLTEIGVTLPKEQETTPEAPSEPEVAE